MELGHRGAFTPRGEVSLLSNAKLAKYRVENIFDANRSGDGTQCPQRETHRLAAQFGRLIRICFQQPTRRGIAARW